MAHAKRADREPLGAADDGPTGLRPDPTWILAPAIALLAALCLLALGVPAWASLVAMASGLAWLFRRERTRSSARDQALATLIAQVDTLDGESIEITNDVALAEVLGDWSDVWRQQLENFDRARTVVEQASLLPAELESAFDYITLAASGQEEAVEETASLVANMRQSVQSIADQASALVEASGQSAAQVLEMTSSIDEVATSTAALHEVVEASTSAVHQMGASIRQVAVGAEQVQEMAETTAASVVEMDRSVQEVSDHAVEASTLTERAHEGAIAGREAVDATIRDIEQISALSTEAMKRLDGLVGRISQIGSILSAIDEINDETNLLSLNAAIIAAQAGEQGKAFRVVANHVKTLARRTSSSTQHIEKLISDIQLESGHAVEAMEKGIQAVIAGVERSRDAGRSLESIQQACHEASDRVSEIARSTAEQSRTSKGVSEATQQTSDQIQQIGDAIAEQRRASEAMLVQAETALDRCRFVHRSTEEQRTTSQEITTMISQISGMIREIAEQAEAHSDAGEAVGEAVVRLLDHAKASGTGIAPFRSLIDQLVLDAEVVTGPDPLANGERPTAT